MAAAERQKLIDRFLHLERELFQVCARTEIEHKKKQMEEKNQLNGAMRKLTRVQYRRDVFPEVLFTPELWVEWSMLVNSRCWERSNWESVQDETRKDYFFAPFVDLLRHRTEENSVRERRGWPMDISFDSKPCLTTSPTQPKALFMNDIRERYPSVKEHRAYFEGKYSGQNHFVIIAQRDYDIGDEVRRIHLMRWYRSEMLAC